MSSVVHTSSVSQLSLNLMRGFLSNVRCSFALGHTLGRSLMIKGVFQVLHDVFAVVNMGPFQSKISKRYSSFNSL